jgi:hypothetical protein
VVVRHIYCLHFHFAGRHRCQCILLPTQAEQAATALHLAHHPQVAVCVDAAGLQQAIVRARPRASTQHHTIAPHKQPTSTSAEQTLLRLLQQALPQAQPASSSYALND